MKFTNKSIAALKLPQGKRDHLEFDDAIPGFGLRLRDGGSRTWIYQYKIGSHHRRMVLGRVAAIPADRARQIAGELHAKVRLGGDPANDKAINKVRAANSFGDLIRRYLEIKKSDLRPRSFVEVKRHLEKNARSLHALPVTSIDRRTIADLLNRIAKENGTTAANRARASLSAMFGWSIREGLVDANPVMNTGKREERSRDRVLTDTELTTIWNTLEADHYGAIIRLLVLTGQRANEIGGLQWPEIDFDHDKIVLPADRTKNARAHEIPMAPAVRDILSAQSRIDGRSFVFGYGSGQFSGWSKSKAALDARIQETTGTALPHWTVHDLRRTAATRMADLGIAPHVIEAVLNHVSGHKGGIAGIYNRALYSAEKGQALALWADHLTALVEKRKSNITPLKRA